jgi:hypothetical protein
VVPAHEGRARPKLYFVKVDVVACFDSISQGKLFDILRQLLGEVRMCPRGSCRR